MFFRFCIKDFNELSANGFTFGFRVRDTFECCHELFFRIYGNERDIKHFEHGLYLFCLIFTQQSLVYEDTDKLLFGQGFIQHGSDHRRVYPSGDTAKDFFLSDLCLNGSDLLFGKASHIPGAVTAADMFCKVLEHRCTLYRVVYLRVELEGIDFSLFICNGCIGRVLGSPDNVKTFRQFFRFVTVAHPDNGIIRYLFKNRGAVLYFEFCFSILMMVCGNNFSAKVLRDQLHTVTDTEDRQAKVPDTLVRFIGIFCIDRRRAARKDDPLRFSGFNVFK